MEAIRRRWAVTVLAVLALGISLSMVPLGTVTPNAGAAPGTPAAAPPLPRTEVLVVRLYFHDFAERDRLATQWGADEISTGGGYLTIWVDRPTYSKMLAQHLHVEIDQALTQESNNPALTAPHGPDTFYGGYKTVEEMQTYLDQEVAAHPTLAVKVDFGNSWCKDNPGMCTLPDANNGYDLFALHITNQAISGPKPVYWYEAAIHSREIAVPEVAMRFIGSLLDNYDSNADSHWLVDYHDIWVVPMLNPDGHHIVEAGGGGNSPYYQRKNANHNNGCTTWPPSPSNQFGTDNNRNFSFLWNCCGGSSGNACDQTYRGPSPASDPETFYENTQVRSLIADQRGPNIGDPAPITTTGVFQDMHSNASLDLYPWGFQMGAAPNGPELANLGKHLSATNAGPPGNGYQACQPPNCLYAVDGDAFDWAYGELGAASFSTEVGGSSFFPAYSYIDTTLWPLNRGALTYQAKIARTPYLLAHGPDANSVTMTPMTVTQGTPAALAATINYAWTGNSFSQSVGAAEYYVDTPPWAGGTAVPMTGNFTSATVAVSASVPTGSLSVGRHIIFVRGRGATDYLGYQTWGAVSAVFLGVLPSGGGTPTPTTPPANTATATQPPLPTNTPTTPPTVTPTATFLAGTATATPSCGGAGSYRILIAYADSVEPTTLRGNLLAQPGISVVDLFDAQNGTPTLAQMQQYDLVLTYSNYHYSDPTTLGDNLAAYQDGGGIVITSFGALYNATGYRILGRWQSGGYSPYMAATTLLASSVTLGAYDPMHPLMQGVTTLNAGARFDASPAAGATQVAAYSDGSSAVAFKTTAGHTAVSLPAFVGAGSGSVGYARIIVNAARWLAPVPACGTPTTTSTPAPPTATPTCGASGQPGPWATASPYPSTIGRYGFAQTGNDFYVISGVSEATDVDTVSRYNTVTDAWTSLAPLPIAGEAPAAAYFNGKIYVAGGNTSNGPTTAFQIYDIATNTWTAGPDMPAGTWGAAAGAYNGKVFVAGGNFLPTSVMYVFDIAGNTWTTGTSMPSAYLLGGYQQVGQYLYVIGSYGTAPQGSAPSLLNGQARAAAPVDNSSISQRLDMTSAPGVWTTGPVFTMQHGDFGLSYANGILYALGGDITGGGFFDSTTEVDSLDTTTWPAGIWAVSSPALPSPRQANQGGFYNGSTTWSTGGLGPGSTWLDENLYRTTPLLPCQSPTATVQPVNSPTATTQPVNSPTATTQPAPTFTATVPPGSTATATVPPGSTATATSTACAINFSDVHPSDYFYTPVQYLYCHGVISGYSDGTFRP
ncbi:MAG: M14 family zinc carboxypeptidase, partial [Chloroflexia bacterium]